MSRQDATLAKITRHRVVNLLDGLLHHLSRRCKYIQMLQSVPWLAVARHMLISGACRRLSRDQGGETAAVVTSGRSLQSDIERVVGRRLRWRGLGSARRRWPAQRHASRVHG
jgi:hypothetical protein